MFLRDVLEIPERTGTEDCVLRLTGSVEQDAVARTMDAERMRAQVGDEAFLAFKRWSPVAHSLQDPDGRPNVDWG